ncbi:hypothetical protein NPIL_646181 [Nephila pilipes]|uniref:Uncharacterized protein n=1 Tax=Nephila pilipes TaxID=299642 RepID=A0A8X6TVL3_NEPPI|nr:hypothetical protein NPIL_646181 [Nephila pilipes]
MLTPVCFHSHISNRNTAIITQLHPWAGGGYRGLSLQAAQGVVSGAEGCAAVPASGLRPEAEVAAGSTRRRDTTAAKAESLFIIPLGGRSERVSAGEHRSGGIELMCFLPATVFVLVLKSN